MHLLEIMDSQEFISFFIPPVAYRLSITSSLLPVPGPYIDHSNRCVPVQQGKTTGQTRFSMTSHHPILTSFRAGWTHKRNICFLWSCLTDAVRSFAGALAGPILKLLPDTCCHESSTTAAHSLSTASPLTGSYCCTILSLQI